MKRVLFFLILTIVVFYPFFFLGKIPFPGDYLMAWYQPWKETTFSNKTIGIAHKPVADDIFRQIYPYKNLIAEQLKRFEPPLWNPYNGAGMPLLATMHVGILTPFNLFFLILPSSSAWAYYTVMQFFLVLTFTYLFVRKIGISVVGSLLSSISFAMSGIIITRLIFGEYVYVLSFLPFILYIIESYLQNEQTKIIYLLTPAVLVLFLSGQPQIILYVLLFIFCYSLFRLLSLQKNKTLPKTMLTVSIFVLLGIGMAMIQLLPTIELFLQASIDRLSSSSIFSKFLLSPLELLTIFIPNYFGSQATYNYWGTSDYIETINYIGAIPCFLAYLGIFTTGKNRKIALFFWWTVVITILSTLNWTIPRFFFHFPLPVISTGAPSRIFALTSFSLAVLAGMGFDYWIGNVNKLNKIFKKSAPFIGVLLLILVGTFAAYKINLPCNNKFITNCRSIALRNTILELTVFFTFLAVLLFGLHSKHQRISYLLIIVALSGIGIYNSYKFLPFSKPSTILPETALIEKLKSFKDTRSFGLGSAHIKTDFATYFHYFDPDFYDPLYIKRYGELVDFGNNGRLSSVLKRSDVEISEETDQNVNTEQRRERLFTLLSIGYLVYNNKELKNQNNSIWSDKDWTIVRRDALPRIYLVSDIGHITQKEEILKRIFDPSFNPLKSVILEKYVSLEHASQPLHYQVKNVRLFENSVFATVASDQDSILVLTDNYYPGWRAYIDNRETEVYRANYTLKSILLPKGNHLVGFKYEPEIFRIGEIISITSFLMYILFVFQTKSSLKK